MMKKNKKGSTIIEVLVAATLISIAVLAALNLSTGTQKQTDFSRHVNQATIYNSQALDWLRNVKVILGWANFANEIELDAVGSTVTYCLNTLTNPVADFDTNLGIFAGLSAGTCPVGDYIGGVGPYQREAVFTLTGTPPSSITVVMHTYWADKDHEITTETQFTEY